MNETEKIIEVLGIIAIILILLIFALIGIYVYYKFRKNQKTEERDGLLLEDEEKQKSPSYNIKSIFNFMEFERIEDNMIIQKRGKYLMAIECQGINYDLMSEMERASVEQGFIQFLNTLTTEIQIYVQTRTVNLEDSVLSYKEKFKDIEDKYMELENQYTEARKIEKFPEQQMQKIYMEYVKQKNKYEYTKDIIANTERNSLNRSVLHKKYYIIIPYYEDEIITENYSKEEIQSMIFSELYTKARSIIRTLSRCNVNAKVLDSEGLIDLLYVAYNRDEADIFGTRRAMQAGFEDIYTTAPDVFEKKLRLLNQKIEEEGMKLANEAISEARSDKEMLLRVREQNMQNLILDFADDIIDENKQFVGEDVSADAKVKIKMKRKEVQKGGTNDAKENKTRTRKTVSK